MKKVAVVGGGVAGVSIALYLGELGVDVTLFEKSKSLVNGPPICHLHAGGNLYREISDEQCKTLLKESIELMGLYPQAIDYRPTVLAVPTYDEQDVTDLLPRLKMLSLEYEKLTKDKSQNYFKLYSKESLEDLKSKELVDKPKNFDEWMIPVAKNVDFAKVKFPLIIVKEYGINIFRLASIGTLALRNLKNVKVKTNTYVKDISTCRDIFGVHFESEDESASKKFDYLVNAAGFRSGEIDDMLGFKRERLVEFKAAYVSRCQKLEYTMPEIIFHGQRGTPRGMAQFTPYPDGYYQLHAMTKDVTLFEDGLVKSTKHSSQPKLKDKFLDKIEKSWDEDEAISRTKKAIDNVSNFIPGFSDAKATPKPLYGAQQIPGFDATLRAADVSFEGKNYARCEIVKASSVLGMADDITNSLIKLGFVDKTKYKKRDFKSVWNLDEYEIQKLSKELCKQRDYPQSLASRNFASYS
jgi:glycine/D-amino acid oxidase-like deaminating enzyme